MKEEWKPLEGFPGLIQSNLGRIMDIASLPALAPKPVQTLPKTVAPSEPMMQVRIPLKLNVEPWESGGDNKSVVQVAVHIKGGCGKKELNSVRRMTKARAQQSDRHPIPFFHIGGQLTFSRTAIDKWVAECAADKPIFTKRKKGAK